MIEAGPSLQRVHQGAAAVMAALSAVVALSARKLEYYSALGPGPGFFPLWLALAMGVLSLIWLLQVSRRGPAGTAASILPPGDGLLRVAAIVASLSVMALLMDRVGFQLSMFLYLGFLLRVLGGQRLWVTAVAALLGSFGLYQVFVRYLDLPLPTASLDVLSRLGL